MSSRLPLDAPPREVLVIVTRRIGDVLLAAPFIRSVRQAWPDTAVDALVFAGTEGVLAGNADVRRVLTVPPRPRPGAHLKFMAALYRQYALAVSLVPGDRPTLYACIAGRRRIGLLTPARKEAWKRRLLHDWVPFDNLNTHTVRMHLALTGVLHVPPLTDIPVRWNGADSAAVDAVLAGGDTRPLAVLHAYPKYRYKMWPVEHWGVLGQWLGQRGYRLALTGSGEAAEVAFLSDLAGRMPAGTVNTAGRLTLGGSACLASRAALYVGADTAMTHVAAALGVPTIALFGPSNPVKWGPWPQGHPVDRNPWRRCGSQRSGNVVLLQGSQPCVPCLLEGCDRHVDSASDCLLHMPVEKVMAAAAQLLGE